MMVPGYRISCVNFVTFFTVNHVRCENCVKISSKWKCIAHTLRCRPENHILKQSSDWNLRENENVAARSKLDDEQSKPKHFDSGSHGAK